MLQREFRIWPKLLINQLIEKHHSNILLFQHLSYQELQPPPSAPFGSLGPSSPTQRGFAYTTPCLVTGSISTSLSFQILHILLCPSFSSPSVYSMPISDTTQLSPRQSCHRNGSTSKTNTHPRNTDGGKKQTINYQHQKWLKLACFGQKYLFFGGIFP